MRRGTTPTVVLTVTNDDGSDIDLTDEEVYVTFNEKGPDGAMLTKRETDEGVEVTHDAPATEKTKLGKVQAATTENAYVTFVRSSWSTSSDTSTLPVTPCFVYSTGDGGLYYCS